MSEMKKNKWGFTLIEILIAIAILSLIMLALYTIVHTSTTSKDRTITEDRGFMQIESALDRLEFDFMQMYSPLFFEALRKQGEEEDTHQQFNDQTSEKFKSKTVNDTNIPIFDAPDRQTLIFIAVSNRRKTSDIKQSNFVWIKYALERNDEPKDTDSDVQTGEYNLVRYYNPKDVYSDEFNWDQLQPQVLAQGIKSLEFSFWDELDKKYVTTINELKNSKMAIRAIKINLEYIDVSGVQMKKERTIRTIWPFFDTAEDEAEKLRAKQQTPSAQQEEAREESDSEQDN